MGVNFRPIGLPGDSYSKEEESQFRRTLENYLIEISSAVNSTESAKSGLASSASKRESFIGRPCIARSPMHSVSIDASAPVAVIGGGNFINYVGGDLMLIGDNFVANIDYIYGAPEGTRLTLLKEGSVYTVSVRNSGSGNGSIKLDNGNHFNMSSAYDNITLIRHGPFWVETSRATA